MRRSKKGGFALIYVICVIVILSALTLSALVLISTNRISSAHIDRVNKAQLAAESGIDAGISALKIQIAKKDWLQYVKIQEGKAANFDIPEEINGSLGDDTLGSNAKYDVKFEEPDSSNSDNLKIKNEKCIKITSTGTFQSITKTIEVYIDVTNISNVYFDRLFNSTLTGIKDDGSNKLTFNNDVSNGAVTLGKYTAISSDQNQDTKKKDLIVYKCECDKDNPANLSDIVSGMYDHIEKSIKDKSITPGVTKNDIEKSWIPTYQNDTYTKMLEDAKNKMLEDAKKLANDAKDSAEYAKDSDQYAKDSAKYDKIKNYNLDDYIKIFNKDGNNGKDSKDSKDSKDIDNDFEKMLQYSTFYKVIFINGNIKASDIKRPLVNYVIYCNGDIDFGSPSEENKIRLWNCNIYAKSITVQNETYKLSNDGSLNSSEDIAYYDPKEEKVVFTSKGKKVDIQPNVEIMGISSKQAKISILQHIMNYDYYPKIDSNGDPDLSNPYNRLNSYYNALDPKQGAEAVFHDFAAGQFSPEDMVAINDFLLKNINEYAYGLKFRIIDWEEK